MARDGSVLVKFVADTLGFRKGTTDMADALKDAEQATKTSTAGMSTAFRDAGVKIQTTNRDTLRRVKDDGKREGSAIGKETGQSVAQNFGQSVGSGTGSMPDAILGVMGDLAGAIPGAGAVVAVGAAVVASIVVGINAQKAQIRAATVSLFDQMRAGMVDQATAEGTINKILGTEDFYSSIQKLTERAQTLGVPFNDVYQYLKSAGEVATPALVKALAAGKDPADWLAAQSSNTYQKLQGQVQAAREVNGWAGATATAYRDAGAAVAGLNEAIQAGAHARDIQTQQAQEYAAAMERAWRTAQGTLPWPTTNTTRVP